MKKYLLIILLSMSLPAQAITLDELYKTYSPQGAAAFDAERGKKFWDKENVSEEDGKIRTCHTCHGDDLTKSGKHIKTKKVIDPLAQSVNAERFTELKKIEKWFKRNCKWTVGRECTDQEKGDLIKYLIQF